MSSATLPIIESKNSHRPGEDRFVSDLKKVDIVSLDIFDTAIFRDVEEPKDIFRIMSSEMNFDQFYKARIDAEEDARMLHLSKFGDDEITIDDIYNLLSKRFNIDSKWKDREIELEIEFCHQNPYIKHIFDKLKEAGKPVIFCSDMYLPRNTIVTILNKCGYENNDGLFLSNELNISKKTGKLYEFVNGKFPGKKIYHIDDNYRRGVSTAKECGWQTYYYRPVRELAESYRPKQYNDLASRIANGIVNASLLNGAWKETEYFEHGFRVGGIMAYGYCQYLERLAAAKKIDKILFCSRDCDIISKVYREFFGKVESEYIQTSRYALMNSAPERYFTELVMRTLASDKNKNLSVSSFLSHVSADYLITDVESAGIRGTDVVSDKNVDKIMLVIQSKLYKVINRNYRQINSIKKYLQKILNGHKNILIVDVGWSGSCISVLNYIIGKEFGNSCNVSGALMIGNNTPELSSLIGSGFIEAYIASPVSNLDIWNSQKVKDRKRSQMNNQMLEYMFTSTDSTLVSYGLSIEKEEVTFNKSKIECQNPNEIKEMQKGILAFSSRMHDALKSINCSVSISPYAAYAPFEKILTDDNYCYEIYKNFAYDAAIYHGKEGTFRGFGNFFPNLNKKHKVLLVSHSMSNTGAPNSLLRQCNILIKDGNYCEVWSPFDGDLRIAFEESGAVFKKVQPSNISEDAIKKFDCAIVNTILCFDYYRMICSFIPIAWFIREASDITGYCSKQHNFNMYHTMACSPDLYCVSEYAKDKLQKYCKFDIKILKNCVEDTSCYANSDRNVSDGKVRFIQMGTIEPRKAYDVLIKAYDLLDSQHKQRCELYFAGQYLPKSKAYYDDIIKKIHERPDIHYLGNIKDVVDKTKIMSNIDVVVVASLDESCSLVALEGCMLSKPLIVTENVGAKYMVSRENGLVVKTNDASDLSHALATMIDKQADLRDMGRVSRQMYELKASMDEQTRDVTQMVEDLCSQKKDHTALYYAINGASRHTVNGLSYVSELLNNGAKEFIKALINGCIKDPQKKKDILNKGRYILRARRLRKIEKSPEDRILVSMTTFPERIKTIDECIKSIEKQSIKPDQILLYLASEQFPNRENDLPSFLRKKHKVPLKIIWCDDLKPHKKYFYAMQENPNSVIITVDDDEIYDKYMIASLYKSYKRFPRAVSCMRAHRITFDKYGNIKQYRDWKWEDDSLRNKPSFQALATGCSGILYPPKCLDPAVFDKDAIRKLALMEDDLWLKIMETRAGTRVVLAGDNKEPITIKGTQEHALGKTNVGSNMNDVVLLDLLKVYDKSAANVDLKRIIETDSIDGTLSADM